METDRNRPSLGTVGEEGLWTLWLPHNAAPCTMNYCRKKHPCLLPAELERTFHRAGGKEIEAALSVHLWSGSRRSSVAVGGAQLLLLGSWGHWGLPTGMGKPGRRRC